MKWISYIAAFLLGCATLQVLSVALGHIQGGPFENKDYLYFVQTLVTFITAVFTAVIGFGFARSNEKYKANLTAAASEITARLQADLAIETAKSVEKIRAEFTVSTNDTTEKLRLELGKSSEVFKIRLSQTVPQRYSGYHAIFKAATKYFFAVRRLEEGVFPELDLVAAALSADEAIGTALLVDDDDRDEFFDFIREANFIAEQARAADTSSQISNIWLKEGKKFREFYNKIEENLAAKVKS